MGADDGALRGRRGMPVVVSWCGMDRVEEYGRGARRRAWWWSRWWAEGGRTAGWSGGQLASRLSEYRRIRIEGRCRRGREEGNERWYGVVRAINGGRSGKESE
jgi:hypothetical protein